MKKMLAIALCCVFLAGCENRKVFSWAQDPISGDFESLKLSADTAMQENNYSAAAKYYKAALDRKPDDPDTALGYAAARLFAIIDSQFEDKNIVSAFLSNKLSGLLKDNILQGLIDAVYDSMGVSGQENGYLASILNQFGASADVIVNAVAVNVLLGMAEFLSKASSFSKQYVLVNEDYTVELLDIPQDSQEKQTLLRSVENLIARVETASGWIQGMAVSQPSPELNTVNGQLTTFKAELNAVRCTLSE